MTGAERIAAERQRQVTREGWEPGHDDGHDKGEMVAAAICYAAPEVLQETDLLCRVGGAPLAWPWGRDWWKPGDGSTEGRIRELEKAGALIAAEIDRLTRRLPESA